MTEFTSERLAELKAVAEGATQGEWSEKRVRAWGETYSGVEPLYAVTEMTDSDTAHACAYPPEPQDASHIATFDPPTTLSLIAALEAKTAENVQIQAENESLRAEISAKTYEAQRLRATGQGLIKQRDEARAEVEALDRGVWRMRALRTEASADRTLEMVEQQRDEARAEVEELRAWQAQTVRRVRDTVASEHVTMLVVEDIPNADYGELIDTLAEQRDDARAALKAKDSYVGDLEEQIQHIKSLWRATGRAETDAHRRADRAEAAIERAREAATEVASQGDNLGRTHYEKCWTQHLHCLAAKINFEAVADDDTQP